MKHFKIVLFVIAAMSLTTCTSVDEAPEKTPIDKEESPKVYYTIDQEETEELVFE